MVASQSLLRYVKAYEVIITQGPLQAACNFGLSENRILPKQEVWIHNAEYELNRGVGGGGSTSEKNNGM